MTWKDVAGSIGTLAPAIGAVLAPVTGGASLAIGGAVGALTKAFGLNPDATPDQVLQAVNTDPETALKLMLAENDFMLKKRDQDIEELKILLLDTQSARGRQTESEKATGKKDINLYILAWVMVLGFFVLLAWMLEVPVPEDQNGVVFMLFGSLSSAFGAVIQYFFGSSAGSQAKSEQMSRIRSQLK
jgi:hypothetical protein